MLTRLSGDIWSALTESVLFEEMTSTFDGKSAKSLHVSAKYSFGFHSPGQHPDRYNLHVLPIVAHFRGLADRMSVFSPDNWHVVSTDANVDKSNCVMLREGSDEDQRYRELWFDTDKNYSLVRRRDVFEGRTENEVTIRYTEDEHKGWFPSAWQIDRYADGRLIDHSLARVKRLKINEPVDDATFVLEFPPGTEVNEERPPKPDGKKP